jgi:hypothetical protein
MWGDQPPPVLCHSPFFFPFFFFFLFPLCSFIYPFISFRRSVDAAERDGSRKELGAERLVTFPAGAMSSSQIESEQQWDCKLYAPPTNFMDMDYARKGGRGFPEFDGKESWKERSSVPLSISGWNRPQPLNSRRNVWDPTPTRLSKRAKSKISSDTAIVKEFSLFISTEMSWMPFSFFPPLFAYLSIPNFRKIDRIGIKFAQKIDTKGE